ncbi:MAG: methyltransferase domain-containing protein [Candidatus Magasanikbacteria bacterium]|nr:methyltransferase domain-containing protein [Candidatus Magasanikbacteria bacterium]
MSNNKSLQIKSVGWGRTDEGGIEIWDTKPVFCNHEIGYKDRLKLLFYPKKYLLYNYVKKHFKKKLSSDFKKPVRILDVGCGTGATLIDFKKMFGRRADIIGLDVIRAQVDLAKEKTKKHGVWVEIYHYDGLNFPFEDGSFDIIYSSDVLGHVKDVPAWLREIRRILKPSGILAMFAESSLGKHAYIRNYMLERGLNTDPHAEFHISLYSKLTLKEFLEASGFEIKKMYSSFWLKFVLHPDELYPAMQKSNKFPILKFFNKLLYSIKKKLHPYSAAVCELVGLIEMVTVGRFLESQGYIILAKKK